MSSKEEIFASFDIEATGPQPGRNSMISLGAVVIREDGTELGRFYRNLKRLSEFDMDESTRQFWEGEKAAWVAATTNPEAPSVVMNDFNSFIGGFKDQGYIVSAAAYPASYDFKFLDHYSLQFAQGNAFGFTCLDMKSMAFGMLDLNFMQTIKRNFPDHWHEKGYRHNHIAVDDAAEQGRLLVRMLARKRHLLHAEKAYSQSLNATEV